MPLSLLFKNKVFPYLAILVGDGSPDVLFVISVVGIKNNSFEILDKSEMFNFKRPAASLYEVAYAGIGEIVKYA